NYWQDKFLALRKEKRHREDDDELEEKIVTTKEISADVGEFLRYIRGLGYFHLEEFYENLNLYDGEPDNPDLPEGAAILDGETSKSNGENAKSNERSLVEMIVDSSEELMAENADLNGDFEESDELDEGMLSDIPGLDLLR